MYPQKLWSLVLFTVFTICTFKSFAEPANLGLLKKQIMQYHDTGDYLQDIEKVADEANHYIEQEVLKNKQRPNPQKLAIVLDIDETTLSNYQNMKSIDFANLPDEIKHQLLAADEPAIKPMLDLYLQALQQNIAIFFVTGRDTSLEDATVQNLHAAGYLSWAGLEFRQTPGIPTIPYKTAARAKITAQGYTIIASFGDQESDLVGGYAQKTFKLPNPYYFLP